MTQMSSKQVLDREFLEIRAKVLQIAASFDRIDRAEGDVQMDARVQSLLSALHIVSGPTADRAERIQMIFSRDYREDWQSALKVKT